MKLKNPLEKLRGSEPLFYTQFATLSVSSRTLQQEAMVILLSFFIIQAQKVAVLGKNTVYPEQNFSVNEKMMSFIFKRSSRFSKNTDGVFFPSCPIDHTLAPYSQSSSCLSATTKNTTQFQYFVFCFFSH